MLLPELISFLLTQKYSISIAESMPVSGGSINRAYKLSTNRGSLFLKYTVSAPDDFFEKEADGLNELSLAGSSLRVPEVIAAERPAGNRPGFLLLEYIEEGRKGDSFTFGAEMARLHQTGNKTFGLTYDNYIGSLPQQNGKYDNWISFFIEKRIEPQLKRAIDAGILSGDIASKWNRLAGKLPGIIPACKPSLLHGDLWSGNYLFDKTGTAVLIDPAVYYGHPEVDLAFSKMFGGFSIDFYRGYESLSPLERGFEERVPIYNLYPLLVHVNLFGGHYTSQAERILSSF